MKYPIPEASKRRGGSYYRVGDELIPVDDVEYLDQKTKPKLLKPDTAVRPRLRK